jgi:hypothetical protein
MPYAFLSCFIALAKIYITVFNKTGKKNLLLFYGENIQFLITLNVMFAMGFS